MSNPADVDILCSDGSTAGSATPAPASATSSDCAIVEVAGTSGAVSDGFYYDDGSNPEDGVAQYKGYDNVNGELTRCLASVFYSLRLCVVDGRFTVSLRWPICTRKVPAPQ